MPNISQTFDITIDVNQASDIVLFSGTTKSNSISIPTQTVCDFTFNLDSSLNWKFDTPGITFVVADNNASLYSVARNSDHSLTVTANPRVGGTSWTQDRFIFQIILHEGSAQEARLIVEKVTDNPPT